MSNHNLISKLINLKITHSCLEYICQIPFFSLSDTLDAHSELEGEAPDGSFANRNGRHAIGHVDDFSALQQQVLEGRSLVQRMETTLQSCLNPPMVEKKNNELVRSHTDE